jgi:hypothetical protein
LTPSCRRPAEFGPGERAAWVKQSIDICEKKGVLGAGYIPKAYQTTCLANSEGLFAYYQYAETGFILTCRMANGSGSGWSGVTGAKDLSQVNVAELTEIASTKALKSQKPRAIEPGRYTTIIEPRPAARLLSTMIGAFNAGGGGRRVRGRWWGRRRLQLRRHRQTVRQRGRDAEGRTEAVQRQLHPEERRRQSDPAADADHERRVRREAGDVDRKRRAEERVLRRRHGARQKVAPSPASPNMSLVVEGGTQTIDDMVKSTKRGLLVTFFWYLRPVDTLTLLNTGMTRDGLFLIENGEIAGPVQNFRWNMSPLVAFANISAIGKSVPIHTGEAYDGPGTALVPAIEWKTFYMTSVSPRVESAERRWQEVDLLHPSSASLFDILHLLRARSQ